MALIRRERGRERGEEEIPANTRFDVLLRREPSLKTLWDVGIDPKNISPSVQKQLSKRNISKFDIPELCSKVAGFGVKDLTLQKAGIMLKGLSVMLNKKTDHLLNGVSSFMATNKIKKSNDALTVPKTRPSLVTLEDPLESENFWKLLYKPVTPQDWEEVLNEEPQHLVSDMSQITLSEDHFQSSSWFRLENQWEIQGRGAFGTPEGGYSPTPEGELGPLRDYMPQWIYEEGPRPLEEDPPPEEPLPLEEEPTPEKPLPAIQAPPEPSPPNPPEPEIPTEQIYDLPPLPAESTIRGRQIKYGRRRGTKKAKIDEVIELADRILFDDSKKALKPTLRPPDSTEEKKKKKKTPKKRQKELDEVLSTPGSFIACCCGKLQCICKSNMKETDSALPVEDCEGELESTGNESRIANATPLNDELNNPSCEFDNMNLPAKKLRVDDNEVPDHLSPILECEDNPTLACEDSAVPVDDSAAADDDNGTVRSELEQVLDDKSEDRSEDRTHDRTNDGISGTIRNTLRNNDQVEFKSLLPAGVNKKKAASLFSQMLGLIQSGLIKATQDEPYAQIKLTKGDRF